MHFGILESLKIEKNINKTIHTVVLWYCSTVEHRCLFCMVCWRIFDEDFSTFGLLLMERGKQFSFIKFPITFLKLYTFFCGPVQSSNRSVTSIIPTRNLLSENWLKIFHFICKNQFLYATIYSVLQFKMKTPYPKVRFNL